MDRSSPAGWQPRDPAWQARVRGSFARPTIMRTIGAGLGRGAPGEVEIELPFREDVCPQHGFLHAGVVTAVADSACGHAALSLMPPAAAVLTVEFKVNLLAPAHGDRFVARGRVLRPGRTLTAADVLAVADGRERPVAAMLTTMMPSRIAPACRPASRRR